jgi:hypothetical protein
VLGYYQTSVISHNARIYSEIKIAVPPVPGLNDLNDSAQVINALTNGTQLLNLYNQVIEGPLFIPTLQQFLYVGNQIANNFDQLGSYGDIISRTSIGQTFMNLLHRGAIHFAPAGPAVDSLISFLSLTYPLFGKVRIYIHASESIGADYLVRHARQQTLAFIVLRRIDNEKVDYVIRQRHTALPSTNLVVRSISPGLFTDYQQYFLSGFLSIQKGVDAWVFNYTNSIYSPTNLNISQECNGPPNAVLIPFPISSYQANPFYLQIGI